MDKNDSKQRKDQERIAALMRDPKALDDAVRQRMEEMKAAEDKARAEREQRARADALAQFTEMSVSSEWGLPRVVGVCPWCAAMVLDTEKHLDWHGHLNETAQRARTANFYNMPLT